MKLKNDQRLIILLSLLSASLVFVFSSRLICLADWSLFTEYGYRFFLKQRPYLDFGLVLTPGTFIVQGLLIKIFGVNYYAQLAFVAFEAAVSMILTWMILKEITQEKSFVAYSLIPLVFLVPGVLGPFPDYDYDSCVVSLLAFYFFIKAYSKNDRRLFIAAGLGAVLVFFFKQTIGAGVIAGMITASFFLGPKKVCYLFGGILTGLICFTLSILMMSGPEGLPEAVRWIFSYAGETRGKSAIPLILNTFKIPAAYLYAASWVISYFLFKANQNKRSMLLACIFFVLPFLPSNFFALSSRFYVMEKYLAYLWPGTMLTAGTLYIFKLIKTKTVSSGLLIFVLCTVTSLATFASHGLIGSTYGIWPFFFLIWVVMFNDFFTTKNSVLFFTLFLLIPAGTYLQTNVLNKSVIPWKFNSQTASWRGLKGLTTPGPWIYNFEELLTWTEAHIPHDDRVISLPGEDPFYSLTGRYPQLSIFLLIPGGLPFDLEWLEKEIRKANIKWIILKTNLQLPNVFLNTDSMMDNLKHDYSLVQTLKGYEIYKINDSSK
jgi:hypothetical protein